MSTALAVPERRQLWTPTKNELAIVKSMNPKASTENLAILLNIAAYSGLNPIKRQLCMFVTKNKSQDKATKKWEETETVHIYTTLDGARVIAHRSGRLDGIFGLELADAEGHWYSCLPSSIDIPYAARCSVRVKGCSEVFTRTVYWSEFGAPGAKYYDDGNPKSTWAKMPRHMLLKVAESHALRAAFPDDLGDILTDDEVSANPEWASQVRQQGSKITVTDSHPPAPEPKRPPRELEVSAPPSPAVEAELVEEPAEEAQPELHRRIAYLGELIARLESDSGDVDWARVRKTLSSVHGLEVPSGKDQVDFSKFTAEQLTAAIETYEEIAREEADFANGGGSDDEGLYEDGYDG